MATGPGGAGGQSKTAAPRDGRSCHAWANGELELEVHARGKRMGRKPDRGVVGRQAVVRRAVVAVAILQVERDVLGGGNLDATAGGPAEMHLRAVGAVVACGGSRKGETG